SPIVALHARAGPHVEMRERIVLENPREPDIPGDVGDLVHGVPLDLHVGGPAEEVLAVPCASDCGIVLHGSVAAGDDDRAFHLVTQVLEQVDKTQGDDYLRVCVPAGKLAEVEVPGQLDVLDGS